MKVGKSVQKSLEELDAADHESAMLHACNAVDGTARKAFPKIQQNKKRFLKILRGNYSVLGPMGMPGIDLNKTRFPVSMATNNTSQNIEYFDIAELIYKVHRCAQGHGDELPNGFELINDIATDSNVTKLRVDCVNHTVRLSDRIIPGLLAVSVFSESNLDEQIECERGDEYYLSYNSNRIIMYVNQWWGRGGDFVNTILPTQPKIPNVKLDFSTNNDPKDVK